MIVLNVISGVLVWLSIAVLAALPIAQLLARRSRAYAPHTGPAAAVRCRMCAGTGTISDGTDERGRPKHRTCPQCGGDGELG